MSIDLTDPIFYDETKARAWQENYCWPNGPTGCRCGGARVAPWVARSIALASITSLPRTIHGADRHGHGKQPRLSGKMGPATRLMAASK
jgi:hypothetical protein